MSNILLSYPQVPHDALYYVSTNAYADFRTEENLITGERYNYAHLSAATTGTIRTEWDLGTSGSATIDHVIISRADLLVSGGITTVLVEGGNGSSPAYSTIHNDASFASSTLLGRGAADYYATFSTSSAYRWFRYSLTSGSSTKYPSSTVHLGTLFDFDVDPDPQLTILEPGLQKTTAIDGTEHVFMTGDSRYQLDLEWRGVTDAKAETFMNEIVPRRYVFIREVTDHGTLLGAGLIHCEISQAEHTDRKDGFNTIKARFVELLG